ACRRLAVKKQFPAVGLFFFAQCVRGRFVGRCDCCERIGKYDAEQRGGQAETKSVQLRCHGCLRVLKSKQCTNGSVTRPVRLGTVSRKAPLYWPAAARQVVSELPMS